MRQVISARAKLRQGPRFGITIFRNGQALRGELMSGQEGVYAF